MEETDKFTKQWKSQLSESNFNKFLSYYAMYTCNFIEKILLLKRFNTYGAIILDKDIHKLINYFQSKGDMAIRENFERLISFSKILNFESNDELLDYVRKYDDICLNKTEVANIWKLKSR